MSEIKRIQGMVRSIDQWLNMVPSVVATGSMAQVEYALVDAKTDIEALWLKVAALSSAAVAEREPVLWADPQAVADTSRSKHGSYTLPLYLDPPPTSELEAENARLRNELSTAWSARHAWFREAGEANSRANAAEARLAEVLKALEMFPELFLSFVGPVNDEWFNRFAGAVKTARRVREGGKADG